MKREQPGSDNVYYCIRICKLLCGPTLLLNVDQDPASFSNKNNKKRDSDPEQKFWIHNTGYARPYQVGKTSACTTTVHVRTLGHGSHTGSHSSVTGTVML